jgi:hypothetical protein
MIKENGTIISHVGKKTPIVEEILIFKFSKSELYS